MFQHFEHHLTFITGIHQAPIKGCRVKGRRILFWPMGGGRDRLGVALRSLGQGIDGQYRPCSACACLGANHSWQLLLFLISG